MHRLNAKFSRLGIRLFIFLLVIILQNPLIQFLGILDKVSASGFSITITNPDSAAENGASNFNIEWQDTSDNSNARISLYYDNDNSGLDGILIKDNIEEDPDGGSDSYSWNTTIIEEGTYYIYAIIEDDEGNIANSYSTGTLSIPDPTPTGYTLSGTIDGKFTVLSNGSASYSIPISVSPGTSGLDPSLSLSYNSQTGNGLIGVGWSLDGLSTISRCPATVAQDGSKDPVNFNSSDKFCLDGRRLISTQGTYGANNSVYRTEIDSFTKVISYGVAGSGPEKFMAWTKSGLIMEYGYTANSRVEAQGRSDVLTWNVNKISDIAGNYMTVTYHEDNTNGVSYPTLINYTANDTASLASYASVEFIYEDRDDKQLSYLSNSKLQLTKRLKEIKSLYGTDIVRKYNLSYEYPLATKRSRLVSIQECGINTNCLSPKEFTYGSASQETYQSSSQWLVNSYGSNAGWNNENVMPRRMADVNGDGKLDIVGFYTSSVVVSLATGSGFATPTVWINSFGSSAWNNENVLPRRLADVNGDGMADIVGFYTTTTVVSLSTGTSFAPATVWYNGYGSSHGWDNENTKPRYLADVNGDGRMDVVGFYSNGISVALSTGTSFAPHTWVAGLFSSDTGWNNENARPRRLSDVNGDGMVDIIGFSTSEVRVSLSNGTAFDPYTVWISNAYGEAAGAGSWNNELIYPRRLADVNADGLADIIGFGYTSNYVSISTGTSFTAPAVWATNQMGYAPAAGSWVDNQTPRRVEDINGDGKADLIGFSSLGVYVSLSTGESFRPNIRWLANEFGYGAGGGWNNENQNPRHVIDITGDGIPEIIGFASNGVYVSNPNIKTEDRLIKISNAGDKEVEISYKPLTDSSIFTKSTGAVYSEFDYQGAMFVVDSYNGDNLVSGTNETRYKYEGAKIQANGRGFLGFKKITTTNVSNGIKEINTYETTFPYIGMLKEKRVELSNGTLINSVVNTFGVNNTATSVYFPYVSTSVSKNYELNGSLVTTGTTSNTFDNYGNALSIVINYGNGSIETTTNTYSDNVSSWLLGRLVTTQITSQATAKPTQIRTSSFEYNSVTGLLTKEIIEPGNATLERIKTYTYDAFGNVNSSSISGPSVVTRTSSSIFDSKGRFETAHTNPLSHVGEKEYNPILGTVTKITSANNLETNFTYDEFGRILNEIAPDNTKSVTRYILCDNTFTCPTGGEYFVYSKKSGFAPSKIYFDRLNREIRKETIGSNGEALFIDTKYLANGQIEKKSNPYFAAETPVWTTTQYDVVNRQTKVIMPDTSDIDTVYSGLTTTVTNGLNQTNTKILNEKGQLVQSIDANNKSINYSYDVFGNLITLTDSASNQTVMAYDIVGNRISIDDPDNGLTTSQYNAFGELISETDALNQTQTISYDLIGRTIEKVSPEGTKNWNYDVGLNAIGKINQITTDINSYQEDYTYDNYGRLSTKTTMIDSENYDQSINYNFLGFSTSATYPNNFSVKNVPNQYGQISQIRKTNDDKLIWSSLSENSKGQTLQSKYGNGITTTHQYDNNTGLLKEIDSADKSNVTIQDLSFNYDALGNLTSRSDNFRSLSESFAYDSLNRLTSSTVALQTPVTVTYNDIGNITSRSDVGTYTYAENGAGAHAVTTISGAVNASYSYDLAGNRLNPTNDTGSIAYSSNGFPSNITEGDTSIDFSYSPDDKYFKQTIEESDTNVTLSKIYIDNIYVKELKEDSGNTELVNKYNIFSPKGIVAVYEEKDLTNDGIIDSERYIYLHKDHLGSIESVTDEAGSILENLNYDAWGRKRDSTWSIAPLETILSNVNKGFTGHEQLDQVSLIHMGGRVYDPVIGRFLTSDPFIQAPENSQSLNRYSYVVNNPLSNVDPSGYFFKSLFKAVSNVFESVSNFVSQNLPAVITFAIAAYTGCVSCAAWVGAGMSAAFTLVNTGNIGAAVKAGVITYVTGEIFSFVDNSILTAKAIGDGISASTIKVLAHGFLGGAKSVVSGGKFEHGFISGSISQLVKEVGTSVVDAIEKISSESTSSETSTASTSLSGTVSEQNGGKSANGAITESFERKDTAFSDRYKTIRNVSTKESRLDTAGNINTAMGLPISALKKTSNVAKELLGESHSKLGAAFNLGKLFGENVETKDYLDFGLAIGNVALSSVPQLKIPFLVYDGVSLAGELVEDYMWNGKYGGQVADKILNARDSVKNWW